MTTSLDPSYKKRHSEQPVQTLDTNPANAMEVVDLTSDTELPTPPLPQSPTKTETKGFSKKPSRAPATAPAKYTTPRQSGELQHTASIDLTDEVALAPPSSGYKRKRVEPSSTVSRKSLNIDLTSPSPEPEPILPANEPESEPEAEDQPLTPQQCYALIQQPAKSITGICCATCRKPRLRQENEVVLLFKNWVGERDRMTNDLGKLDESNKKPLPSSVVSCNNRGCTTLTCIGCGALRRSVPESEQATCVTWCCDRGRLAVVWVLLCGYDRRRLVELRRNDYFRQQKKAPSTGVGYGGSVGYDLDYSPVLGRSASAAPSFHQGSRLGDKEDDEVTQKVLCWLNILLLPDVSSTAARGRTRRIIAVTALLLCSLLPARVAELLRNESLEDATRRISLYMTALDLVTTLKQNAKLTEALAPRERPSRELGQDLMKRCFRPDDTAGVVWERSSSMHVCIRNLDKQSKALIQRTAAHHQDAESDRMLELTQRISSTADILASTTRSDLQPQAHQNGVATTEDWQSELALLEVPDQTILSRYKYAQEAASMRASFHGRMKSLSTQLLTLTTSLPPGIFVRHCASRLDVMKILIVGPSNTPYQHGLFEFDLFCPANFPHTPPKMEFRTTGGGAAHFNPNLYANGKVCLSLLGTWQGETWQAGKSTILQVLVSIQAMIFCDHPWCNEPGRERMANSKASLDYNKKMQALTVRYAMLGWLKAARDPVWGDVVAKHFGERGSEVCDTLARWCQDGNPGVQELVAGLRHELTTSANAR
ncbi:hypothetical protein MBLNU230_g8234t1 [Neophaeotheca triangularis]